MLVNVFCGGSLYKENRYNYNDSLAYSQNSVTFNAPFQMWTTNSLTKFNGIVILALSFYTGNTDLTVGGQTELGYVPEGFRPKHRQSVSTSDGCTFVVNTTGVIQYTINNKRPYSSVSLVYIV